MRTKLDVVGAFALATYIAHALLSWFLAAGRTADPRNQDSYREFFRSLGESFWWAPEGLRDLIAHGGPFQDWSTLVVVYALPLVLQTLAFAAALWLVTRAGEEDIAREDIALRLRRWAMAFAIVSIAAFNVMTPDIWLAIPWGRMLLEGHDPYLSEYAIELAADTPGMLRPTRMTYGPLWVVVSIVDALIAAYSPMLAWLAIKALLLGAWLGCLALVARIAQTLSAKRQALAMVIMGWLPIGVHSVVAEGHNDAVMLLFLLLAVANLQSASWKGPFYFVVAVLTKLVVIPAALVDAIYHYRARTMTLQRYLLRAVPALIVFVPAALIMFSADRLDAANDMRYWRFLQPMDVLLPLQTYLGLGELFMLRVTQMIAGLVILRALYGLWQKPAQETAWMAMFAILSGALFTGVGHVWPWFYVWLLPFAALLPASLLTSFVLGAAIIAPYSAFRVYLGNRDVFIEPALIYATAMLFLGVRAYMVWRARNGAQATLVSRGLVSE